MKGIIVLLLCAGFLRAADAVIQESKTDSGVAYYLIGSKPLKPGPVVFIFGKGGRETLQTKEYLEVASQLAKEGFLAVSLDIPSHGTHVEPGEPVGLKGWRWRLEAGRDFVPEFCERATNVLDHLVREGYADRDRLAVFARSRGSFMGFHWVASNPSIRCAAAIAPVTDVAVLEELAGVASLKLTSSLALKNIADRMSGRRLWFSIGQKDKRVGTDRALEFAAAIARHDSVGIELRVYAGEGHYAPPEASDWAAEWVANCVAAQGRRR